MWRIVRRLPFTNAVVAVMVVVGLATGSFWSAAEDRAWYPYVAYGLPSFAEGRWWTLLTGPFLAVVPLYYLPMTGTFALLVGATEWRLGTRVAAVAATVGQVAVIVASAGVLLLLRATGWEWATGTAQLIDVGFSAGSLACAALLSGVLPPPWRLRLRLYLVLYVLASFIYLGSLADVEHLLAVGSVLVLGRALTRNLDAPPPSRPTRREWRTLASAALVFLAVESVVTFALPGDGPLGDTTDTGVDGVDVAVSVIVAAVLVNGLRKGRRVAWRWAVAIAGLNVLVAVLVAVLVGIALAGGLDLEIDGASLFVANRLVWIALFVLLVAGRSAFRVPSRRGRRTVLAGIDDDGLVARLHEHGGGARSWMGTWPEYRRLVLAGGRHCQTWQPHTGVAIGLGDPIGPASLDREALRDFAGIATSAGLVPCIHLASDRLARVAGEEGWHSLQVTEDLVVDLGASSFDTSDDGRSLVFRMVTVAEEPPASIGRLRSLVEANRQGRSVPEIGFAVGGLDEALDRSVRVGLVQDGTGLVHGAASWLPVHAPGGRVHGWTSDLVVCRDGSPEQVVEQLLAGSCRRLRDDGAGSVVLSGAPLAVAGPLDGVAIERTIVEHLFASLSEAFRPPHRFRGVRPAGAVLRSRPEPLHLIYRDPADLPRIGVALTRAYLPHAAVAGLLGSARSGDR